MRDPRQPHFTEPCSADESYSGRAAAGRLPARRISEAAVPLIGGDLSMELRRIRPRPRRVHRVGKLMATTAMAMELNEDLTTDFYTRNPITMQIMNRELRPPAHSYPPGSDVGIWLGHELDVERNCQLAAFLFSHLDNHNRMDPMSEWGIKPIKEKRMDGARDGADGCARTSDGSLELLDLTDLGTPEFDEGNRINSVEAAYHAVLGVVNTAVNATIPPNKHYTQSKANIDEMAALDHPRTVALLMDMAKALTNGARQATSSGKCQSQMSCLAVGVIALSKLLQQCCSPNKMSSIRSELHECFEEYLLLPKSPLPDWVEKFSEDFDVLVHVNGDIGVLGKCWCLTWCMWIYWARFDQLSFVPASVALHLEKKWMYIKIRSGRGDGETRPAGMPKDLAVNKSITRTVLSPWLVAVAAGLFNASHGAWRFVLVALGLALIGADFYRRHILGSGRRRTWCLPYSILSMLEKRSELSKRRERRAQWKSRLTLAYTDPKICGCFGLMMQEMLGMEKSVNAMSHVSFRAAFLADQLDNEDIRANAHRYLYVRVAKDSRESHLNHIRVAEKCAGAGEWWDSAGFVYLTTTVFDIFRNHRWLLNVPFYA